MYSQLFCIQYLLTCHWPLWTLSQIWLLLPSIWAVACLLCVSRRSCRRRCSGSDRNLRSWGPCCHRPKCYVSLDHDEQSPYPTEIPLEGKQTCKKRWSKLYSTLFWFFFDCKDLVKRSSFFNVMWQNDSSPFRWQSASQISTDHS